jgi:integrase
MEKPNNRPKTGDVIKVEPIKTTKDISLIKKMLAGKPRDLAIFTTGINTALRASDLTKIKVGMVKYLVAGESFLIREQKTKKLKDITLNKIVLNEIGKLLITMPGATDENFLFQSKKGTNQPLEVSSLHRMVKGWCSEINLTGNYGSHSLRKTFGYVHRTVFNTDIPTLMTMFNHSTQKQTLAYLCIQEQEIKDAYLKEI